jgi:3D (Asp-Asp-Asp) domain-containing protein
MIVFKEKFSLLVSVAALTTISACTFQYYSDHHSVSASETSEEIKQVIVEIPQPIVTKSSFEQKFITQSEPIEYETEYKDDPETEAGIENVVTEGKDGKKVKHIKITYYQGKEYERDLVKTETIKPENEVISRGTKIVWKTLQTADGEIRYWKKMRVYATHYDQHCRGCNEWTAIGMRAGKGVIAVDPKVIKMRSEVYIPGYGKAVAGDTGGAIKGNIIDLGFEDAKTAGWSARYIDIYLM